MSHVRRLAKDGEFGAALSGVLRLARLAGSVGLVSEPGSPWTMRLDGGESARFHIVLRGRCRLTTAAIERELGDGDCVLLPWGDPHTVSAGPVELLCGCFELDRGIGHPLFAELPELIRLRRGGLCQPRWPEIVSAVLAAARASDPMPDHLTEALLIELLRGFALASPQPHGFLAAAMDRRIARALSVIHQQWRRDLALADLAQASGMSRSNLVLRFKELLGITPVAYLTSWRMQQARQLLITTDTTLIEIAELAGYASESAFSRAFKRALAHSPSRFRRTSRAEA